MRGADGEMVEKSFEVLGLALQVVASVAARGEPATTAVVGDEIDSARELVPPGPVVLLTIVERGTEAGEPAANEDDGLSRATAPVPHREIGELELRHGGAKTLAGWGLDAAG